MLLFWCGMVEFVARYSCLVKDDVMYCMFGVEWSGSWPGIVVWCGMVRHPPYYSFGHRCAHPQLTRLFTFRHPSYFFSDIGTGGCGGAEPPTITNTL